ncbi:predicted protein [Naegleria gruberi]|uniref:Predicted protein n=1 Tax=Naegleria gruberi TaxID=5762 RepID=D2VP15_NAEGR|nr:uncharacterized protein NAEGRDRAFT_70696 [Naegleria gruberi]EFC41520.1 predicted protein [Naegleria gruberi]|eukprot:XP_002674264.1 predicted protein [Naegleria gruberi strain NEG-M]
MSQDIEPSANDLSVSNRFEIVFSDDALFEILSFHDDFKFIVMNCALVSTQWMNVIRERVKLLSLTCSNAKLWNFQTRKLEFLPNITTLTVKRTVKYSFYYEPLKTMNQLTSLNINGHFFCKHGIPQLWRIIDEFKQLTNLNIGNNIIGDIGVARISEMKQLTSLNVCNNDFSQEGVKSISGLNQLTQLNIVNNRIGSEGVNLICGMVQLTSLNIATNYIGFEGAKLISTRMKQLTILDIYNNNIGQEGAEFISKMNQLTKLNIGKNNIGQQGAKYISEMKQLTTLNISRSHIGRKGEKYIREMRHLTFLDLGIPKKISSKSKNYQTML